MDPIHVQLRGDHVHMAESPVMRDTSAAAAAAAAAAFAAAAE